ncbi:MAG: DUF2188 domain-containing protein [Rhodospirillaceae bacterium]|nr:DUF2188 domain-containing protein [Rhodospirillaceae bacterium]MDD9999377.1 DUF2188 domain-containing protein [Rhodospirillaceae bacterium]
MTANSLHVVPRGKKWAVRKTGVERVTRRFDTQQEAIKAARGIARKQGGEVFIHGWDGRIRRRDSHGNDNISPSV